jgi:hypothetical protein
MFDMTDLTADRLTSSETISLIGPKGLLEINKPGKILMDEGGEDFYKYADWFGLAKDPGLIVLSSLHHYFYDEEDLKNIKTVINLKELNQIKGVKSLLHSCLLNLPHIANFIGCFVDNDKISGYVLKKSSSSDHNKKSFEEMENGIISRFPFVNMLYSIMDSKINSYMSKRSVSLLLENYGFKIIDMTDHNGVTFFYSQKTVTIYN